MKRTTLTASLLGSAAAGLIATAIAAPAWAQATTYPEGTDCSAISNSTNRTECMNQMNESRQNAAPGSVTPSPDGSGNIQQGAPNAPDNRPTTGSSPNNGQGSNTGAGGDVGTNGAGTSN